MCGCLWSIPYWRPGPQPKHVPLTGNRTGNPLVYSPALYPLSHTSQGYLTVTHCFDHYSFAVSFEL